MLGHPVFAIVAYVGIMWAWHVPALYDAALSHSFIHVLEHVCFLSVGLLYWWRTPLSPIRSRHRRDGGAGEVLSTRLLVGLLGIGLTFAPELRLLSGRGRCRCRYDGLRLRRRPGPVGGPPCGRCGGVRRDGGTPLETSTRCRVTWRVSQSRPRRHR